MLPVFRNELRDTTATQNVSNTSPASTANGNYSGTAESRSKEDIDEINVMENEFETSSNTNISTRNGADDNHSCINRTVTVESGAGKCSPYPTSSCSLTEEVEVLRHKIKRLELEASVRRADRLKCSVCRVSVHYSWPIHFCTLSRICLLKLQTDKFFVVMAMNICYMLHPDQQANTHLTKRTIPLIGRTDNTPHWQNGQYPVLAERKYTALAERTIHLIGLTDNTQYWPKM